MSKKIDTRGNEGGSNKHVQVLIELTDFCNYRCIMCKQSSSGTMHGSQPKQFLKPELFRRLISDLKEGVFHATSINPLWAGESMLHPKFKEMMSELFRENKRHNFFNGFVLNTNASLMSREISDLFIDYAEYAQAQPGFFFKLVFSLEAIRPVTYAKIKGVTPQALEKVIANIEYLVKKRTEKNLLFPNLAFAFIVMEENYSEAREFKDFWSKFLQEHSNCSFVVAPSFPLAIDHDLIYFRQLVGFDPEAAIALHRKVAIELGLIDQVGTVEINTATVGSLVSSIRKSCAAPWRTPNICASGVVTPCCRDLELSLQVGDINRQSLADIWDGKKITALRLAHINGNLAQYPTCLHCIEPEGGELKPEEIDIYLKSLKDKEARLAETKKLNICILSREYPPETNWGGIGTYTFHLATGLARAGHSVHVICQSLDIDKEYEDQGVRVHRVTHKSFYPFKGPLREFGLRWEYSRSIYQKFKEVIERYQIDIVEAPNLGGEGLVYSFHKTVPLVTRLHTHFSEVVELLGWKRDFDMRLSCAMETAAIRRSDLVFCSTKAHADLVAREIGMPPEQIRIIPLGVPLPVLKPRESENHDPIVLFIGRLEKRKGVDDLIQAIPKVLKEVPLATFLIVGRDSFIKEKEVSFSGEQKHSYKELLLMMLPLEYRDRVKFLGYVSQEDLEAYFRSCDLFVAPSLYESFGFIYIEAMSYAKPVIGCAVGGVPEVIKDGETGILVPPQGPHRLAIEIISLLKDPTRRLKMGIAGRKDVEQRFNCEQMVEDTLAIYTQICTRVRRKAC